MPEPPAWLTTALDEIAAPRDTMPAAPAQSIPAGRRNDTLARLGGLMRRGGMSGTEILAALNRVNIERCQPPLVAQEVAHIAASIARYEPNAISVALIEDHFTQDRTAPAAQPVSVRELLAQCRLLRPAVIQGLLRRGETMNVIAPPKTGKALAIATPILTETGWMTMGDIQPGMKVHTADGSLTEVVAVSEVMHGRPCYRVTSRSGASLVADQKHLWRVTQRGYSDTVTTEQLLAGRHGRRWLLPVAGAVIRPDAHLPLDPWLLGYWLGNGTAREGAIAVNSLDFDDVIREVKRAGFEIGKPIYKRGSVCTTVLKLKSILREMGLLRCKHIPSVYLLASGPQRLALLSGLLDSDGYAITQRNGSGAIEFTSTDPELFFQTLMLARSLGYKASTVVGRATLNGVDCGHKLRIWIAADQNHSPFRLARRTAMLPARPLSKRSRCDAVASVVPVASVPVKCIQVAHPSGLFLAGEDFMVTHNSWLVLSLAMAVATGRRWLGAFHTIPGRVLILDNELHRETLAHRIPAVAEGLNIGLNEIGDTIHVQSLRGQLRDILSMSAYFETLEPGAYAMVILDAFYRFMPAGNDENDNGAMAQIYNRIDAFADRLGCCFVLIHHTTKGNQSTKSVTDVGAGAGSQSRATDTHLVLRPHEEQGAVVLDAAVRSWPPLDPFALRWSYPVWMPAEDLDPEALRSEKPKKRRSESKPSEDKPPDWSVERFVEAFITDEPASKAMIRDAARDVPGLSWRRVADMLELAVARGLIHRWCVGRAHRALYATRPQPVVEGNH